MGRDVGCACSSAAAPVRVADRVCWRWGRRPRGDWRRARLSEDGGGTGGPVAASTRPPPTSTRRVLSWRAPLRRRRLCVADRVCWRWGRRPRGDWRRVRHSEDGGGTEGPVAASTRPPPTSIRRVLSWRAPLRRRRLRVACTRTVGRGDSWTVPRRRRSDALQRNLFSIKQLLLKSVPRIRDARPQRGRLQGSRRGGRRMVVLGSRGTGS